MRRSPVGGTSTTFARIRRRRQAYGIQGVPFFVIDGQYGVSGAQPPEAFANVLRELWAKRGESAEIVEG